MKLADERKMRYIRHMNNTSKIDSQIRGEQVAKEYEIIKLGLDVHADSIRVVRIIEESSPQPAQRFSPAEFLKWVGRQIGLAQRVYSCYEAGPFGYGLHRKLQELGLTNYVVRPQVLNDFGVKVNTDKTDALALAQRLDRYVRGNNKALAVVRVPTPEEEQKRIASRQRQQLRNEHKRLAAQGRSLLLSQGHRQKGKWWKGMGWAQVQDKAAAWLQQRLEVFRTLLQAVEEQLSEATQEIEAAAPACRPKGLGGLSFETINREVGDWSRFKNRKQVGSYTGLCAGVSSSGLSRIMLSVTKCGNVRLRTALVELAWRMVQWQSQCKAVQKWKDILLNGRSGAGARKKAIVALARQLAIDLWRWQTERTTPEKLGWVMVGN